MIDILSRLIRNHFYIVHFEKFVSESDDSIIDRFVGKHPDLKPELILLDNEPYGFKKQKDSLQSFEDYPVSIELSYFQDGEQNDFHSLDLYCDMKVPFINKITDVIYVANLYSKTILVERVKQLTDSMEESLVITSKLSSVLNDMVTKEEFDFSYTDPDELAGVIGSYMQSFAMFIKVMDDLLVKDKSITQIDQIFEAT